MTALLELDDIHTYYGESHILRGVSLTVDDGEVVTLIGRNGVGKTTTLRSILQLTPPRDGSVRFAGTDLTGCEPHEVVDGGIGWVPEDRRMFAQLTVEENIRIAVPRDTDPDPAFDRIYDLFPRLQERHDMPAGSLSGGEQQMLAISRGLAGNKDLLLIDEPSEGLAPKIVASVVDALETVSEETTVLLIEQNLPLAVDIADRYYLLDQGRVIRQGETSADLMDDEDIRRYLSA